MICCKQCKYYKPKDGYTSCPWYEDALDHTHFVEPHQIKRGCEKFKYQKYTHELDRILGLE